MAGKQIAFVLYPGLTPLDMVGPLQAFSFLASHGPVLGAAEPFEVTVVGAKLEPVATDTPLKVAADKTFSEAPHPYGLFVPGGGAPTFAAIKDDALIAYVRQAAETAEVVGSICTGSLILAAAGLLDGRRATTHWGMHRQLDRLGAQYVAERWVEDGKFVTAAGISAGIDMALHIIQKLTSEEVARQIQMLLEYDPQPPLGGIDWSKVDRDAMAPVVAEMVHEGLPQQPDMAARLLGIG